MLSDSVIYGLVCALAGFVAFTIISNLSGEHVKRCSIIKNVDGCDKYGQCGILLENGDSGIGYHPVPGQKYCWSEKVK